METLKAWKQWEADHHGCPDQQGLVTLHLVCQGLANSDLSSVDAELIHEVCKMDTHRQIGTCALD